MTAREFLRQARNIDRRIDETSERAERIRARLESGRMSSITGMPRGGAEDWTATADRLIELERSINAETREMCRLKKLALKAIRGVKDDRYREVLELYYIDGLTWGKVAERMGLRDVRWVYELHCRALRMVRVPEEFSRRAL